MMVPPRLSDQMDNASITLGLSVVPFAWGFYLLFTYRNFKERILAYLAIAVSLLWVGVSTDLLIQVMKERKIYRSNKSLQATAAGPLRSEVWGCVMFPCSETAAGRLGCHRRVSWQPSLSLRR
jgi:hypothetical protein